LETAKAYQIFKNQAWITLLACSLREKRDVSPDEELPNKQGTNQAVTQEAQK
jgi:hypothetical protein